MDTDTVMKDRNTANYFAPTGLETPTPYPQMYHGHPPNLVRSQSSTPGMQLPESPASDEQFPTAGDVPFTSDFFKRLTTVSQRFGLPNRPLVSGDGIHIQDTNGQSPPILDDNNDQQTPSRGRGRGRGRPRGSRGGERGASSTRGRRGGRSRGWKSLLKGTEHADLFAKPKPARGSTGKKRGRKPGHLQPSVNASGEQWMDPGPEFRVLQGNATRAFLDGDLDTALDYAKLALEKNPEVYMAHKMIHDIYQRQGKERDAIYALAVGVNLRRSAETYADLGQRIMALGTGEYEWARECFTQAILLDGDHYQARVGKLALHLELEEWPHARMEAKALVKKWPAELEHVNKYAELCMHSGNVYEWERAQEAYEDAIRAWAGQDMLGDDFDSQWTHVNDYSDILLKRGLYMEGIRELKRLARWILGRKHEVFWDDMPDDREFDHSDDRRLQLWQFTQTGVSKDPMQYGDGLPLELRVKLGLFRLRMHMRYEALRHFEHLQREDMGIEGLEDVFFEVADSLKNEAMFREALGYYERLIPLQPDDRPYFWTSLAQCFMALDRKEDAETCYIKVMKADEYDLESRVQLARLYNNTGQSEKALKIVEEVMKIGSRPVPQPPPKPLPPLQPKPSSTDYAAENGSGTPQSPNAIATPPASTPNGPISSSTPIELPPIRRRVEAARGANGRFEPWTPSSQKASGGPDGPIRSAEKFDTVKARVHEHYATVKELWPLIKTEPVESNIQQWIEHAEAMAVEFKRGQTLTFSEPAPKAPKLTLLPQAVVQEMDFVKKKALGNLNIVTGTKPQRQALFMGKIFDITAQEWHWILSDLALLYAHRVDQGKCYEVLHSNLLKPVIFRQDAALNNTSQAICLYCALLFNDGKLMTDVAHHYILRQKRSGPSFQLLGATGRLSHGQAYFYDRKASKWLHETAAARNDNPPDPNLLTLCGYNTAITTHANARPALPFLLRALVLQPDNIVINLSIATTYLSNISSKSSNEDRNHDTTQGLAFFHRYYDLRVASGKAVHVQEAKFNRARMWQQLGFVHRAVAGYEKVLEMSERVKSELAEMDGGGEDFTMEAAYALQRVYLDAGNEDAASMVGEKWLVL